MNYTNSKYPVTAVFDKNYNSKTTIVLNEGGARSSKSHSLCQLFIYKMMNEQNKNILITRKTLPALRITAYKMFIDILSDYNLYDVKNHNRTLRTYKHNANTILFTSFDEPTKIQSTEFNYIWMEEAEEFSFEDFIVLKTRLSGKKNENEINQIFLTYNPKNENSYINKKIHSFKDVTLIKSTYKDNLMLNNDYIDIIESLKEQDEKMYRVYALGEYAQIEGQIYNNIQYTASFPDSFNEIFYGLDFGFNSPTCVLKIGLKENKFYIKEKIYKSYLLNTELIKLLKFFNLKSKDIIYADSSESDKISEIYSAGFNIKPADKNVNDGIDFIKSCEIYTKDSNINFNKELKEYVWQKDKNGNYLDSPVKFNDHAMDAMRYAIWSHCCRRYDLPNVKRRFGYANIRILG
jgi:phage terminase large subunit